MDWDKNQLEANIIDARRNNDGEALIRCTLRILCTPSDNIVYSPDGVANMLESLTGLSVGHCRRILKQFEKRYILDKYDEFSLQLNPQFSSKSTKPVPYNGPILIKNDDEVSYLYRINGKRAEIWKLRGKDRRYYTHGEDDMKTAMKKRLDELSKKHDETLDLLRQILANQSSKNQIDTETREKVERHLRLVENDLN